jgi:hypothetical protein
MSTGTLRLEVEMNPLGINGSPLQLEPISGFHDRLGCDVTGDMSFQLRRPHADSRVRARSRGLGRGGKVSHPRGWRAPALFESWSAVSDISRGPVKSSYPPPPPFGMPNRTPRLLRSTRSRREIPPWQRSSRGTPRLGTACAGSSHPASSAR